jgi:hypothetical protein
MRGECQERGRRRRRRSLTWKEANAGGREERAKRAC